MTVTEIAILPIREDERTDDYTTASGRLIHEQLSYILRSKGAQRCFWGRSIEKPELLYLLVDWNTIEDHAKFLGTTDENAPDISGLFSKQPVMFHAALQQSPHASPGLDNYRSPVTEIVTFYFAADFPDHLHDKVNADTTKFRKALEKQAGCNASAGGWAIEQVDLPDGQGKGKSYIMIIGWDNVEAHTQALQLPAVKDHVPLILGLPGVVAREMCHITLSEFTK